MSTLAGLLNHQVTAGQALTRTTASPMASPTSGASGTGSSSDSSDSSATISANDFLTLLVTEMQNQDPTADTDPNEYINQLVQVNSLEQLIDINQTLSTDVGSTSSTSGTDASRSHSGLDCRQLDRRLRPPLRRCSRIRHSAAVLPRAPQYPAPPHRKPAPHHLYRAT